MKLLLDTHILLWAAGTPEKIPAELLKKIEDHSNELFFSAASFWEIAIKNGLGRADFHVNTSLLRRSLLDNEYHELAVTGAHALAVENLPPIHRDPFDRMLVAQASAEGFLLLTADSLVAKYPGPILFVKATHTSN